MTKRSPKSAPKPPLGEAEQHALEGLSAAVARLRDVSLALLDDAVDGVGMQKAVDAYVAACDVALGPPDEAVDLGSLIEAGEIPGAALGAYFAERALLGHPVVLRERASGEMVPFMPGNLDEMAALLDDVDRLDPHVRAERYIKDDSTAAMAVGLQLAREGANELFPLEPWTPPVFRRCVAATAIVAAARAAAVLNLEEEADVEDIPDHEAHDRKHQDVDGMVHVAAAAVDALDDEEREDLAAPGFGAISHLVEDLLLASEGELDTPVAHALSGTLVATFLRAFAGGTPAVEIVRSSDPVVVRILAAADLAGRLAADRLAPHVEPDSPFAPPKALIH